MNISTTRPYFKFLFALLALLIEPSWDRLNIINLSPVLAFEGDDDPIPNQELQELDDDDDDDDDTPQNLTPEKLHEILERLKDLLSEEFWDDLIDSNVSVTVFSSATEMWQNYDTDGNPVGDPYLRELTGLRGSIRGNEIYVNETRSPDDVAATLAHEFKHFQIAGERSRADPPIPQPDRNSPEYVQEEIDVRVWTTQFCMDNELPYNLNYVNPDGAINSAYIENEIRGSGHYNPQPGNPHPIPGTRTYDSPEDGTVTIQ